MIGIKSNRVIFPDGIRPGYLYLENGKIAYAGPQEQPCDQLLDYGDLYVSPGFIDLHTHGAVGYSFCYSTIQGVLDACTYHMQHGTTTICPTVSAAPFAEMAASIARIAEAMRFS